MKVTISFNGTKIVVPCADGEISVREVTTLAATRYKKAIGKTNSYWVSVASLKSHEGGILDADDLIGMYKCVIKWFGHFFDMYTPDQKQNRPKMKNISSNF